MKILCLGNNSYDTDNRVNQLAKENNLTNYGLITDPNFNPDNAGYYHTTTVDLPAGTLIALGKKFDQVILLDQPSDEWTHWKILLSSYKTMVELEPHVDTIFRNNENIKGISFFSQYVKDNKTFCIYPWILLSDERDSTHPCPKWKTGLTPISELKDWKEDSQYKELRTRMLNGEKSHDCHQCYYEESVDVESTRQFETMDWVAKLGLKSLEDLNQFTVPKYYEFRLGDSCNLACRMCIPPYSTLIQRDFKQANIVWHDTAYKSYTDTSYVDVTQLDKKSRVYFTGGEPTLFPEFYKFMQRCIDSGNTSFDFCLGYNGQKLSNKMINMFSHFSNMNFSFSIDGYGKINDYIRSYSNWGNIIANAKTLRAEGHTISLETIPSIYNVTNLHLLLEFFDQEFPNSVQFLQLEQQHPGGYLNAYAHPDPEACARSLEQVKKTHKYLTDGRGTKSIIDSLYNYYVQNHPVNLDRLRIFYNFNDKLDKQRNMYLKDYIPELEAGRKLIN